MAQIAVRKDQEKHVAPSPALEMPRWEPLRMMRDLMGWDPFREMAPFVPQMPAGFSPSFEVKETDGAYVFTADVPGVKVGDLDVTLSGNRLLVAGKREAEKQDKSDTYFTWERTYGEFSRSFTLPDGIDASSVQADLKDGVLVIRVAKAAESQAKKIPIHAPPSKS